MKWEEQLTAKNWIPRSIILGCYVLLYWERGGVKRVEGRLLASRKGYEASDLVGKPPENDTGEEMVPKTSQRRSMPRRNDISYRQTTDRRGSQTH
jgi:hypothetical protein